MFTYIRHDTSVISIDTILCNGDILRVCWNVYGNSRQGPGTDALKIPT